MHGMRIDYFLISESGWELVTKAFINNEVMGSDHYPVRLQLYLGDNEDIRKMCKAKKIKSIIVQPYKMKKLGFPPKIEKPNKES